jgi:hypothetical protein
LLSALQTAFATTEEAPIAQQLQEKAGASAPARLLKNSSFALPEGA